MTKLELIEGFEFSESDGGPGFVVLHVRMPVASCPGTFRESLRGNEARKRFITWILATASGIWGGSPEAGVPLALRGLAYARMASADQEYATLLTQDASIVRA